MVDHTGMTLTGEVLTEFKEQYIETASQLPHKVYAISCWKDAKIPSDVGDFYAETLVEILKHVRGIVRYEATDFLTNVTIRTQTVRHRLQHSKSNIYPSKEAAIEAVRKLEEEVASHE